MYAATKPQHAHVSEHSVLGTIGLVLFAIVVTICIVFFFTERWLFDSWSQLSLEEIYYHLRVSLSGTDQGKIVEYLAKAGIWILLTLAGTAGVLLGTRRNPQIFKRLMAVVLVCALGLATYAANDANNRIGWIEYLTQAATTANKDGALETRVDFVRANYIDPQSTTIEFPEKKKNLIYIYVESGEITYADAANGGAFPKNVIPELTELAREGEDFSGANHLLNGAYMLPGTTWTMGGMFAQTAGVPLKIPIGSNMMTTQKAFFPSLVTLGDILEKEGYQQVLMVGSKAEFGGRDLYFQEHGSYAIYDYNWAIEQGKIPPGYFVSWGLEDEKLFANAREELLELAKTDTPFNLTMLTVDTHFEDGYVCRLCKNEFENNQYSNVWACSSRQLADFVLWIQQQEFYENTTIILCGDHLTMDTDYCADVPENYSRKTYVAIINAATSSSPAAPAREYSTLDMFPTTLAALGATIDGNRLGLGVNLYGNEPTLIEGLGFQDLSSQLDKPSAFLNYYSGVVINDELRESLIDSCTLNAIENTNGAIHFSLDGPGLDAISYNLVNGVRLKVVDSAGKEKLYNMELSPIKKEYAPYTYECDTDLTANDLNGVTVIAELAPGDLPYCRVATLF